MPKLKSKWPSLEDLRIWFSGILSKFVPDIHNAYKNTTSSRRGKLKVLAEHILMETWKTNKNMWVSGGISSHYYTQDGLHVMWHNKSHEKGIIISILQLKLRTNSYSSSKRWNLDSKSIKLITHYVKLHPTTSRISANKITIAVFVFLKTQMKSFLRKLIWIHFLNL